ncbi:MAG: hypothetical protein SPI87_06290 [Anaerobutyricum sp.]|nr:hypothetical protein [Anaerobutyricum sp.]
MIKSKDQQIIDTLNQQPQQGMELLMETYTGLVFKVIFFHLSNPEDITGGSAGRPFAGT